jgi:glutathione S-transferase
MELYYAPLACSLAARVVAAEAGVPIELKQIELYAKTLTDEGSRYVEVAPQGRVPALRLDDGSLLTEVSAVLQYLADRAPDARLAPPWGTIERYRVIEWLSFVGTELHKKILWVHYSRQMPEAARERAFALAPAVFDHLDRALDGREYLVGETFSVADAYLGWALKLARFAGLDPSTGRPALAAYRKRIDARPSMRDAFAAETPEAIAAIARQPA